MEGNITPLDPSSYIEGLLYGSPDHVLCWKCKKIYKKENTGFSLRSYCEIPEFCDCGNRLRKELEKRIY